ncbi:MAG: YhcH/YjgK/YiaL family protein [Rikenellaceae bacterium]|nr:YhcH/YjgK/YiaL family protein [Rikenellaceae bacterium]
MVIDSLKNAQQYVALNPLFAQAFEFLTTRDLHALEPGKHPIDGDNIWANIMHAPLKDTDTARMEAHDRYIDIQVVIHGKETHGWIARKDCKHPQGEIDPVKDVLFFDDKATTFVTLYDGEFAIFFPEDGHQPMIGEGEIRKCVVKVKA